MMVQASLKAAGFLAVALSAGSAAAYSTGNELHSAFNDVNSKFDATRYVIGVVDGIQFSSMMAYNRAPNHWLGCVPEGVTVGQTSDIVKNYINDNPAERHLPSSILVSKALLRAFPCKP